MSGEVLTVGTRGSPLALAQAELVREALERAGHRSRLVRVVTEGDRRAPDTPWGEGAFVAAIERALLDRRVDLAVHSAKDVPTAVDPALRIGAYLPRADARDALVVREEASHASLDDVPSGCRIGTDSPRRAGFLLARRPDLVVHALHGNVDTRLRRLDRHETDALVLACAGLDRLGLGARISERLAPHVVPPAPGQGAIAVQARADDARISGFLTSIDDPATRAAVEAERAFLAASGGGCRAPIGALAVVHGEHLELLGGYADPGGTWVVLARGDGPLDEGTSVARELARRMSAAPRAPANGRRGSAPARSAAPRVLVTRARSQAGPLLEALREVGVDPVAVPTIEVEPVPPGEGLEEAARMLDRYTWVVVTSANGARAMVGARAIAGAAHTTTAAPAAGARPASARWAAVGAVTAQVLEEAGIAVDLRASTPSGAALGSQLPLADGDPVLVVRSDLADRSISALLRARGAHVDEVTAYRTSEAPEQSRLLLRRALEGGRIAAVVFTSGSTVRGLVALADAEGLELRSTGVVCIGPRTADVARAAGFDVLAVADAPSASSLAAATARALGLRAQPSA